MTISRISHIDEELRLECNPLGSMLAMPPGCELPKQTYRALFGEGFKCHLETTYRHLSEQLTILTTKSFERYYNEDQQTHSRELLEAAESYRKGGPTELLGESSQHKHLVEVYPLRIRGAAKLYSQKYRMECSFDYATREKMLELVSPLEYIYEVCFEVKDASLANRKDALKIYLYSWDGQGKAFFPQINLNEFNGRIASYTEDPMQAARDL